MKQKVCKATCTHVDVENCYMCWLQMSTNSFLGHDVDLERLAELTRNFSGAEIEGLVKSAASYALNRNVDINDLHKPLDEDNIKVVWRACAGAYLRS